MKTIYNVAVLMEDQSQCDRMKQLCLDNGLPIWEDEVAFTFFGIDGNYFSVNYSSKEFAVWNVIVPPNLVTESEFIELLKNHKA
jgi:hypothetical protein